MNKMDARACVLLVMLGVSCVVAHNTPASQTDAAWWGTVKPYRPSTTKPAIWEPLVLNGINPPLTSVPTISRGAKAGDPEVFWSNVRCPANSDPNAKVGDGAWTGTYLTDITKVGDVAENEVNVNIVFKLNKPCGKYGTGTISVIGRAGGSDDFSPVEATIAGGTGAFSFIRGGILTVTTNPDNSPTTPSASSTTSDLESATWMLTTVPSRGSGSSRLKDNTRNKDRVVPVVECW